jgi:rare lipoprotein A
MRSRSIRLTWIALALGAAAPEAAAQFYNRDWNTSVVAAPLRASRLTTSALPTAPAPAGPALRQMGPHAMTGLASFYWQGQMTASGERFDKNALTAAHRTLPMHTRVKVTHVESGRTVVVRINDRGPFKPGRVIDLSDHAAGVLGFKQLGLAQVVIEVVP